MCALQIVQKTPQNTDFNKSNSSQQMHLLLISDDLKGLALCFNEQWGTINMEMVKPGAVSDVVSITMNCPIMYLIYHIRIDKHNYVLIL